MNKKIDKNNEKTNKKIEEEMTGLKQQISEIHENWNQTSQEMQKIKEDVNTCLLYTSRCV